MPACAIVDVRKIKGDTAKAVAEATKYAAKSKDYIVLDDWDLTVETVRGLDKALHKRRLVGFGGLLAEARRKPRPLLRGQFQMRCPYRGDKERPLAAIAIRRLNMPSAYLRWGIACVPTGWEMMTWGMCSRSSCRKTGWQWKRLCILVCVSRMCRHCATAYTLRALCGDTFTGIRKARAARLTSGLAGFQRILFYSFRTVKWGDCVRSDWVGDDDMGHVLALLMGATRNGLWPRSPFGG